MYILGIETSCDETAASLIKVSEAQRNEEPPAPVKRGRGTAKKQRNNSSLASQSLSFSVLSNIVSSQIKIHKKYGGIVPEVAARAHVENIIPVIAEAIHELPLPKNIRDIRTKPPHQCIGGGGKSGFIQDYIDLIAVTIGPGLITSLLVGVEAAKILSYVWKKPLIGINHLEGHIYANWLKPIGINSKLQITNSKIIFPAICLVVSGGHTQLILMKDHRKYKLLGQTRDDAAGEAFDKVAKLLGIGYPGGPVIAAYAAIKLKVKSEKLKVELPRPMLYSEDYDFSFSGLKTAVLYDFKKRPSKVRKSKEYIQKICSEFQQAIVDVLVEKTIRAAKEYKAKSIILCGGVAANSLLRKELRCKVQDVRYKVNFLVPPKNLCTDNAAMIAMAGYFNWRNMGAKKRKDLKTNWKRIKVDSNMEIQ